MEKAKGTHLIVDFKNVPEDICLDDGRFLKVLVAAVEHAGATVLSQARYHLGHNSPPGFALVILLDESHCSAHSYADLGLIAMDIFTCGNTKPMDVFNELIDVLNLTDYSVKEIPRFIL